jgi:hypothetical protein
LAKEERERSASEVSKKPKDRDKRRHSLSFLKKEKDSELTAIILENKEKNATVNPLFGKSLSFEKEKEKGAKEIDDQFDKVLSISV